MTRDVVLAICNRVPNTSHCCPVLRSHDQVFGTILLILKATALSHHGTSPLSAGIRKRNAILLLYCPMMSPCCLDIEKLQNGDGPEFRLEVRQASSWMDIREHHKGRLVIALIYDRRYRAPISSSTLFLRFLARSSNQGRWVNSSHLSA